MYPQDRLVKQNQWGKTMTNKISEKGLSVREVADALGYRKEHVAAVLSGNKSSKLAKARIEDYLR